MGEVIGVMKLVRVASTLRHDDPRAIYREITETEGERVFEVGEGWAAIHFMLTGEHPMPKHVALAHGQHWEDLDLENVLMGGEATTVNDAFTVARLLPANQVAALAVLLRPRTEGFASKFDDAAREFLPSSWESDSDPANKLADRVRGLSDHFRAAAAAGDGLLIYVE